MDDVKSIEIILNKLKSNKGLTQKEARSVGLGWPLTKGWKKKLLKGFKTVARKKKKRKTPVKVKKVKVADNSFYRSFKWACLRYEALKKNDGKCELCGRSKHDGAILHVDHVKPIKTHPHLKLNLGNLQVLCMTCNWGKGNRYEDDWREPSLAKLMGEE